MFKSKIAPVAIYLTENYSEFHLGLRSTPFPGTEAFEKISYSLASIAIATSSISTLQGMGHFAGVLGTRENSNG